MKVPVLLSLVLITAGCAAQQETPETVAAAPLDATQNEPEVVCRKEKPTGSNRPVKVCRRVLTEAEDEFTRRHMQTLQRQLETLESLPQ